MRRPSSRSVSLRALLTACALVMGCEAPSSVAEDTESSAEPELVDRDAEPLPEGLDHQVVTYLEQYGRHWPTFRFHGAVVVARGDQVAVNRAFGFADLVSGVPNDTETLFRLGTLSAQLTATAVMRLHEAGTLKLDDPVAKHLPGWPGGEGTTIEHLLTHRSGIPNYTADLAFEAWKKGPRTLEDTLKLFRGDPLEFEPGTDVDPSNSNYVLLGAILEAATGHSYEQVVTEQVLEPLQLEHTHYVRAEEAQATGMTFNEEEFLELVHGVDPSAFGPSGGWLSTTGDMLRLIRGLSRGELVSRHGVMRMQGLTDEGLGYGWAPMQVGDHAAISWPGLIDGFNSAVLHIPEDDTTIIVLSNSEVVAAGALVEDIATLAYGGDLPKREEPVAMPLPLEEQFPAIGAYVATRRTVEALEASGVEPDDIIRMVMVRPGGDHLVFDVPGHGAKRMHPEGKGRYFFKDRAQTRAEVIQQADGKALLVVNAGGGELRFIRKSAPKLTGS